MFSRSFHLECELISLEQENQKRACAVDIQTFKGLLRTLDDPEDVKRIFGKDLVLAGAPTDAAKAEAKEKQLTEVFNMFATNGSATLGMAELQSLHIFLTDAAVVDKKVWALAALDVMHAHTLSNHVACPFPTQRTLFETQTRFSKILRLLLSVFLIVMALLRSLRVSIGAAPPPSLSIDSFINAALDPFFS